MRSDAQQRDAVLQRSRSARAASSSWVRSAMRWSSVCFGQDAVVAGVGVDAEIADQNAAAST